ncbi:MAG: hypothetical protein PHD01_13620, partial [Geobacteraceae bacterium]|nr:hypothetical protein [Geobacteraceae bacterium]
MLNKIWGVSFAGPTPSEAGPFREAATLDNIGRERVLAVMMLCASLLLMVIDYSVMVLHQGSFRSLSIMAIISRLLFCAFLLVFLLATRSTSSRTSARGYFWDSAMVGV